VSNLLKRKSFFSAPEKEEILAAIQVAEKLTSGEIRVHVELSSGGEPFKRAQEVFIKLGMAQTKLQNGVLIYLAIEERKFAIIGDHGIDRVVPENFWDQTKEEMQQLFRVGKFAAGVCLGISLAGEHLVQHFPCQADDVNELSDEISENI